MKLLDDFFTELDDAWDEETTNAIPLDLIGSTFLPQQPRWHAVRLPLRHFRLHVLDVVDVVVSKLVRMSDKDVEDIEAMVDCGRVLQPELVARFRAAADMLVGDAREANLRRYIANLNRVERDMLGVEETAMELPSWL